MIASAQQTIGALVRDAEDAVAEAEKLRAQIFNQQQENRRARMELEHDVSEVVRLDAERLAYEREGLEAQLAENMRQLHTLEQASMNHSHVSRERKKYARSVAEQLRRLKDTDVTDTDAAKVCNEGISALKDVHRQMEVEKQSIEEELQQAYILKERTEIEIADRRQALAINEALLRARYERQMILPEFDELPSTLDEAQLDHREFPPRLGASGMSSLVDHSKAGNAV